MVWVELAWLLCRSPIHLGQNSRRASSKQNKDQVAVITESCNLDFELQTMVLSTIDSHRAAKSMTQASSLLGALAKEKSEKERILAE